MSIIRQKEIELRFSKPPEYFLGKRDDLFSLIPSEAHKILDMGCGSGDYWRGKSQEVTGIEFNHEAAEKARRHLAQVFTGDIDKDQFPLEKNSFDCIIFADILEHLYDPWGILLKYREYLKNGGKLLISVPNIRHYRVLRSLVFKGEFGYEESGILDIDHIRFFTQKELVTMLESTGFEIVQLKRNLSASSKYLFFNKVFGGLFKNFLTSQYYILAQLKN